MTKMNSNLDLQVALNDFSLNFLKSYHQTGDKNSNLFYSPISLSSALSLLLSGADGITKQQLVDLLGYHDLVDTLEVAFKKVRFRFSPFRFFHVFLNVELKNTRLVLFTYRQ